MRMFHMADLHIGKKLNQVSLLEDQRHILEQTVARIKSGQPDVLLLAGDIYDRRNPSVEAVQLLDDFLSRVVLECHVPVIAIGGNHDSGERLDFVQGILSGAGLHIAGRCALPLARVTLRDAWGPVVFHLFPYGDLPTLRYILQSTEPLEYPRAAEAVLRTLEADLADGGRHVLLSHGMIAGAGSTEADLERSDSEHALTVGGTNFWTSPLLQQFSYVALGHLHGCQQSGAPHIRYAGSPLKYSFSEEHQQKGLLQVDLDGDGRVRVETLPLTPLREMRTIRGELRALLEEDTAPERERDFIRAVLTDYGELLEPMARLREKYPNTLTLEREHQQLTEPLQTYRQADLRSRTPEELFAGFYAQVTGNVMQEAERAVLQDCLRVCLAMEEAE